MYQTSSLITIYHQKIQGSGTQSQFKVHLMWLKLNQVLSTFDTTFFMEFIWGTHMSVTIDL